MTIQVSLKGERATEALRIYAENKINHLTAHFPQVRTATVTATPAGQHTQIAIELYGDGIEVRAEEEGKDIHEATDRIIDKLERQMQKYLSHHHRFGWGHNQHKSLRTLEIEVEPEPPIQ